jgi:hypothetical protein
VHTRVDQAARRHDGNALPDVGPQPNYTGNDLGAITD